MASEYLKNKAKQAAERVTKEYGGNAYGGTKWLNGNTSASKTSTTSSTSSNKKINTTNGSTRISTSGDEDVGYSPRLISNTQSRWSSLANNKAAKQYEEDNPYRNYNRQRIDKAVTDLSDELDQTVSSEGRAAVQARLNKALSRQQELMSYDELKARQQTYQDAIDYHYANNVDRLDGEEPNEWAKTRVNELNQEKALAGNSLVEKSVNETMRSITGETKTAVNKYLQAAEDYVKAYQANPGKGKDKEQFYLTAYEQEAKKALQNAGYDETAIANLLEQTKRYVNENAWQSINDMWALNEDSTIANIAKGIAGTGVGILTSPLRALGFGEAVRSKTSKSDYATMDEYSGYFAPQNLANAAYNGVKDKVDWNVNIGRTDYDVFDMLYDTTTSGLESALSMVTGSALTGNAGAATKISGAMLGASAATSTMQDLTSRGASAGMALTGGIVAGIFESLFENLSIGSFKALQEVPVTTWRDWLRNVGKSMLVNFEEEGATELANIIFDTVAMGDYSNYNIMLQTYLESGKTNDEAVKLIAKDFALQVLEAAAGGGIMGLGFSNVGNAANIYGRRAGIGNVISSAGAQQDLINEGLLSGEGTRSNMLANKYNGRSRLTDYQLGKLVEANEQAIQDEETAKSAAIDTAIDSAIEETTEADETLEQNPFEGLGATEQGATATVEAASGEETDAGFSEWLTQLGSGLGKNGQESLRAGYIGGDVETYAGEFLTYYAAGYANENIVDTIDAQSDAVTMNGTQIQLAYEAGVADRMADDAKGGNTSSPEAATASLMDAETSDYTNNTEAVTNGTEQQTTRQAQQLVASEYGPNGGTGAERPISVDSGGQSAAVAAGTSQTAGRQSSSGKTGRSARRSSFESSDGRVSTSASIGLANGTNDAVLVISNEALRAKDEDTYNVKRTLEGMGVRVTVVSGNLHSVSTQNGNVVASRGAFQTDDDGLPHIFIQADNKNLDGRTIAKHELFHLLCKRAPSLKNRVRDSILKDHSTAELRAMVKNYAWLYFTGEEVTPELTKYILEEIYADAYAGIDVFKNVGMNYFEGATKFSKGVYENVSNFDEMQPAGEASENVREEGKASEGGKLSREELDEEYLTAVERGDVETARRMVRETAKQNGYTTQMLYHGTGRFGYTSYDMNAGTNSKGMIYATDKANVAANYGGSRNVYAHQRNINRKLTQGNSVKAVIHNAESVLGMKTHVVTADERKAAIKNVIKGFENIAEVLNSVDFDDLAKIPGWNNEDYRNSVASSWDMTTDIVWTVLGEYATNEDGTWEGDGYEDLKTAVERFEEYYPKFREALIAEKENIKGASVEALYDLLLKHTLFDAAVDAKYTMLPLVKNDGTVLTDGRQFREKDELAAAIDKVKDVGTYMLYGNPGDNILEVDANGRDWLSLKAPKVDDRYHSTDTIANWAKEQGYTSVYVKNVYDGGDKANEYIFFNPEQLKSADPVTYDDNGDVIPLSQRFNRKVQDIRFSQETELTDGQREYFANSKVRDENGNLKLVYHGSQAVFTEFSADFMSMHGSANGQGFYFTDNKEYAQGYETKNGQLLEGYLDIEKPLSDEKLTLKRTALRKLLKALDPTGDDLISNYDTSGGAGYPSAKWYSRALEATVDNLCKWNGSDSEVLAEVANAIGNPGKVISTVRQLLGYDGYMVKRDGTTVYVAFESNQFKNASNEKPTSNPDIRFSQETELTDEQRASIIRLNDTSTGSVKAESGDIRFSLIENENITNRTMEYFSNPKNKVNHITRKELESANGIVDQMVEYMKPWLDSVNSKGGRYLPEEILGDTRFNNGSYGRTIENTTICFRTLAYIDFTNAIKEELGRPLTVEESFLASQMLYDIAKEPQCLYCYVSLDRKAYDEFLMKYVEQRDSVLEKFNALSDSEKETELQRIEAYNNFRDEAYANNDKTAAKKQVNDYLKNDAKKDPLFKEFLQRRKATEEMRRRFDMWITYAANGDRLIRLADLTTEEKRSRIKAADGVMAAQMKDAEAYAQSASWAKKLEQYRSYNGEILTMTNDLVETLNKEYGLRFYSFSEYTPAFIVENMQQIRDAAVKGFYGLAYTKKPDFARIFAPTGMNINISVFARMDGDKIVPDTLQGADWDEVKGLRAKYSNVGAVFVATTDEMVDWALEQDWIDVVIPFHIVRTGANVAEFYKWVNHTSQQADKTKGGKKADITPSEHNNDFDTYKSLIDERNLIPRFQKWYDRVGKGLSKENYMKLVNETRRSASESEKLKPNYDESVLSEAKRSFNQFVKDGGYYGDWYEEGMDYSEAVQTVANDIRSGKRANEVSYGRQDFDATEAMKNRRNRANRAHGQMLSREEPAGLASDYVVDLDDPNISELKENLTWGEASNLLDDLKGLSYRFRNKPDPMSRAEYAMFADRLESVSHYGAYAFSVDESTLTDVQDIMPKILDAWHDMEETDPDMLEYFFGYWDVEGLSDDEITAAFDPEDIVQSAEAYDDERAVAWLWEFVLEPNNIGGIKTNDGAIVLDRNLIKRNLVAEVFTQGERDDDQMLSREVSNQDVLKLMKKTSALEEKVEYWKKQSMTSKAKAKELEKQAEASAKVAESNRQQAEYWKKQTKVSEVPSVDQKSLSKATTSIMAVNCTMYALGTDADRKEVRQRLEELYNFIERGGDEEDELTWTGVWDWATDIARYIAKYSYHLDGDREMVNRARQYLKTHKFYIDPGNAPADFGGWRKEHFGTINVAKGKAPGRVSIDTCWAEMQEILGEGFAREDVDHPWDQLELVVETVARLENTYLGDSDRAYLTNALARTILDEYYNVKEEKTYADRMTKKLNDQKIKNSELKREEREKREKAVAKEREKAKAKLEKEREENRARIEALKQKINDNHEKQMQELKQRYADTEAKRKERQEQRKLKDRINKHVSELSEMLTKPTDKKHIPQRLQSSVANLLESINLESSWSYDDTGKLQRKPGGSPTKRTQAFAKLRDLYKEIGSELVIDPDLLGDAETKGLLDDCIALRDVRIDDMNVEQLSTVLKAVQAIGATIKSSNKMFNSARWATVHEAAAKLQADNATKKMPAELRGFAGRLVTWETLGNMTPDVYMSMLGKTGEELFRVMRNAQDKQTTLIAEAAKFTESLNIKDARKWEQEIHKVTLGGQQVELNTAQIMALYCLARRDQGTQHIYAGGILPDTIQKKGALRNTNVADPIRGITPSELSDTFSVLTLEQRLSAQSMQSFLSKEVADWGNEASMAVYGYKKFGEDHYWPIHAQEIAKTVENHNRVASVSNKGFTKAVEPKATNSLRVSSIFDDFSGHIQEMATYAAWLETSEDLRRIRNYIFRDEEGNRLGTIEGTLKRVHGSRGAAYWDQLQSDIAMGTDPDRVGAGLTGGLTGRFKAAAVGGNIRVIIQQPTAIFRALDMISPTYLMRPSNIMKGWEKAKKYAPIALWKDWGYFEISTGKRMKDVMFKSETTLDKLQRASMWGAGMADSIAWGQLWNACEAEAKAKKKDLKPGTKEFYETVAERFTEIVDRTQVVDGILQRSQNMRSRNELNKMASSFMAEPTKQLNMAMIAAYNLKHSTKGNRKAALGHMARTATALTVSGVINAVAQSIVDAWRDDDRDKDYIERWLESFWGFTGDEESAKDYWDSFWEGNLENPLIITNYLPYMQDVVSLLQGYDVERMDMAIVSDFITAGNTFVKALKGTNKYTIQGAATDLLTTSSKLLGLPLATLERDVKGLLNAYATESNNYVLQYHLDKFWYKTSGEGANRTTFMDTLYRAYTSDGGQYRQIWQDMRANGVTLEQVRSAMESRMAADQGVAGATDLAQRWISPDNIDKYAGCVDELNGNGIYRTMSNEDQKTCRDLIYKYLTEIEKRDVGETEGYKVSDATSKALEMQEHGITFAEYAIFKVSTGDLESDKDEEGKTISGSLKEKRTDAVEDMDFLTSNQKDYLFSQWYSNLEDLPW